MPPRAGPANPRGVSQRLYDCPQCGAPVKFESSIAVFAVCEHCRSMVVARNANVEAMGVMAELPPDLSPFQIGTHGEWNGSGFQIVGRVRVSWTDGSWNEWCVLTGDGRTGWLAEAQGLLMLSFEVDTKGLPQLTRKDCGAGRFFDFDRRRWVMTDVKEATCLAGEGELPFVAAPNTERLGVDLIGTGGKFGTLEFDKDGTRLYVGDYVEFSDLKLQNLRPVPGWSAEVAQEKYRTAALSCPKCGAVVNLRAAGLSMSAVCGSCSSVIDTADTNLKIIQKAKDAVSALKPVLPIGRRGTLRGTQWEVIGLCVRKDQWVSWSEYLLFNPWAGFRWLVTFNGHWSFVTRMPEIADLSGTAITMGDREYKLYASGHAQVTGVLGEFYWKVRRGEHAMLNDFIAPPFILSKEFYKDLKEFTWSHGEYMPHTEVVEAFELEDVDLPTGIYLNQPNPHAEKWKTLKRQWVALMLAVVGIQIFFAMGSRTHEIRSEHLDFDRDAQTAAAAVPPVIPASPLAEPPQTSLTNVQVTPRFKIDGGVSRVDIEATAPVDNNWIGASVELVNAVTNEKFPAEIEVGYYHGYDSDGSWTEGSQQASVSIPSVPPGEYFMTVETSADSAVRKMPLDLRVKRGGLFWSNFILMLLLVSVYPLTVLVRRHLFERRRWSESDYSPYTSSSDNE